MPARRGGHLLGRAGHEASGQIVDGGKCGSVSASTPLMPLAASTTTSQVALTPLGAVAVMMAPSGAHEGHDAILIDHGNALVRAAPSQIVDIGLQMIGSALDAADLLSVEIDLVTLPPVTVTDITLYPTEQEKYMSVVPGPTATRLPSLSMSTMLR